MKKDIRMIALDLDGTVFNSKKEVTPRVLLALQNAVKAGIQVLPATGRQLQGIPKSFLEVPGVRYALVANGARIYDLKTEQSIFEDCFEDETALSLLKVCQQMPAFISLFIGGTSYAAMPDYVQLEKVMEEEIVKYMKDSRVSVSELPPLVGSGLGPAEKITLFFSDIEAHAKAKKLLDATGATKVTSSMYGNWELNTPTANKGAGILALAKQLGIKREHVMAIGDGSNDIDMLQAAGHGVAMGQAPDEVKAAADAVTASCDEDGVALAIEAVL